ncbi:hypothetical protein BLNAU_23355 [Blattamonas nauphoetae]|uniref:Uncharacterized protein n=1 Tax=Blattamonas nauphoetae TaxID=2049346 RepID=A0ABQ9WQY8_9EUKA|nr:hypothetical protein BLNAU_23355 [Blattamonas nauphoetae]
MYLMSALAIFFGSFLSVFRGCDFPSALTELITSDLDFSPHNWSYCVAPDFYLNHTSINPKHRHSFFPMDLMFERYLRNNPGSILIGVPYLSQCTPRKFLSIPCVGLHSLLLRCLQLNLDQQTLANLTGMFFDEVSFQDATQAEIQNLFAFFPPPRFIDTLLSTPQLVRSTIDIWLWFISIFDNFGVFTTPFGACSSLAEVFKMLSPFDSNPYQNETNWLNQVGEMVVSLHWLSIPTHFDSPLLCHLPSLAGAQRGVLQTLSSHSGIPSLVTPPSWESFEKGVRAVWNENRFFHNHLRTLTLTVRYMDSVPFHSSLFKRLAVETLAADLLSPFPALMSAAFEFFHRFVSVSSDAVRIELVKQASEPQKKDESLYQT